MNTSMQITRDTNSLEMGLTTKGVGYYIRLAWMIANFAVVVVKQFHPTSLSHVQLFLVKDMLKAPMVGEDHTLCTIKVVSPDL
ncbi:hypothetical protein HanXRQr2_Chr04g0144971 [Helianthus annuus]|uniref:Uncharacterized protein n=1 Tax=Helianthus annuus TaxID=4232 RepID=A0A9K3NR38_HELAN|nr:hypothetical protein HanXRQr2_Chr04g0144971 [Helianthus annuus]KAJ0929648.1 hypothetical protein HanPSC8_Chr04g0140051 [Helianthus annuus]